MAEHEVVWQSLAWPSTVLHKYVINDGKITGHGLAVGKTDQDIPFVYEYNLLLTKAWDIKSVSIVSLLDRREIKLRYSDEKWFDEKSSKHLPQFDKIPFIDISISPFTNSLPIKKLVFDGPEAIKIDTVYFDENKFSLRKTRQLYSKLDDRTYRYKDTEQPGFTANITVDAQGLVNDFDRLFKRI